MLRSCLVVSCVLCNVLEVRGLRGAGERGDKIQQSFGGELGDYGCMTS